MKSQIGSSTARIIETVTRYVGHEVSLTDDFADDVGLDSIDRLNLMTTVEQAHDIELSDEEMASVSTLQDLLSLLNPASKNPDPEAGSPTGGN